MQALERKQAPSERQLLARLRPLARYQEPAEHACLVDGMVVEHHLRSRISVRPLPSCMQRSAPIIPTTEPASLLLA